MVKVREFDNESGILIRNAGEEDLARIISLDEQISANRKDDYWKETYRKYGQMKDGRYFLVAAKDEKIIGFIIGEIRAWEFGSPPGGWVFTVDVDPDARLGGVATLMFNIICRCFKKAGVEKVHTLTDRKDIEVMSFFRSQGMMAGSTIPLEMDLSDIEDGS